MNREIKFRAWDLKNKIMWEHGELAAADPDGVMSFNSIIGGESYGMVVMQFTGVRDRNGKEIYEGDILDDPLLYPMVVVWNAESVGFGCSGQDACFYIVAGCVVTGNIYENPDLLPR